MTLSLDSNCQSIEYDRESLDIYIVDDIAFKCSCWTQHEEEIPKILLEFVAS